MTDLTIRSTDSDRDAVHESRLTEGTRDIAMNEALVPAGYCRRVLAEPKPPPCGIETGKDLARTLIGCYPKREVNDPRTYVLAVSTVFADYPEQVGRDALHNLIRKLKWLPTAADVNEACAQIVHDHARRRHMARRMLDEHDRRKREAEHAAEVERDRPAVLARMRDFGGLAKAFGRDG